MPAHSDRKSLLIILSVFLFVTTGTMVAIFFARGYQVNVQNGIKLKATGLLSATSIPKGASVYINDKLITATDDTINLTPGEYQIKIIKDGYLPWTKSYQIKKEIVYQTEAQLFRSVPDLRPLTQSGAINPTISHDNSKIIFAVASASAQKDNGLYITDVTDNLIPLSKNTPRQLAPNFAGIDWSKASFVFSPNSRQVIATFKAPTAANYLIQLDTPITQNSLLDITLKLPLIQSEWKKQQSDIISIRLERLPSSLRTLIATESAKNISYSSSDDKVLYLAAKDGQLPADLISPPPAKSTQLQSRQLIQGNYYVYDLKQDTNFLIGNSNQISSINWIPNSNSLVYVTNQQIQAVEYDATNTVTLFAGYFDPTTVFPWIDGSKIITLTQAYPGSQTNLYAISLK